MNKGLGLWHVNRARAEAKPASPVSNAQVEVAATL